MVVVVVEVMMIVVVVVVMWGSYGGGSDDNGGGGSSGGMGCWGGVGGRIQCHISLDFSARIHNFPGGSDTVASDTGLLNGECLTPDF